MMKKLEERFGKLITASFIIMAIGIVTFLLVIPLYGLFGIDTDIVGILILDIGLLICIIGIIRRYKPRGFKLVALVVLAAVSGVPILSFVVSLVYYLITGQPLGE